MNNRIISIFTILIILLSACQPTTEPEVTHEATHIPTASAPSSEETITNVMDAWNAKDVVSLKSLFADKARVCFPDWGDDCTIGTDAIGAWIEELVAVNFKIELESLETEGETVTVVAKVWADPTQELGVAPLVTTDIYTVQDGKITSQTSTLTEESSMKYLTALEAVQMSSIVLAYTEAINAGDLDAALGLLHEQIYVEMPLTLLPGFPALFGGQDVAQVWLEEMMAENLRVESEIVSVYKGTVTVKSKIWSDYLEIVQAAPIIVDEVYKIQDDQILSWNRDISISSLNEIQEGLVTLGIPETIVAEPGETVATEINDIAGSWTGVLPGAGEGPVTFSENGDYVMNGDSGAFWFNGSFLWMRTTRVHVVDNPSHSCLDTVSIGSYIVYVTRSGTQPVELRFVPILDPCILRSSFLEGDPLTLK